jgi:ribosomal protein S18 acetylase RimI-like enzyme
VNVRAASPDDLAEVLSILSEAARRPVAAALGQWPDPFPAERALPALERGDTYLAQVDGEAVGTLMLQWDDPAYWGQQPPVAGYLHRLAVRSSYAGRGLGGELLSWADGEIAARARTLLRLACMTDNPALRQYYERAGFRHCGDVVVRERSSSRYERPVAVRLSDS